VIPFTGSRHVQATQVSLGKSSMLFWWETIAPGRRAAGERFPSNRLRVSTEWILKIGLGVRGFCNRAARRPVGSFARMGRFEYLATFYAIARELQRAWRELEDV